MTDENEPVRVSELEFGQMMGIHQAKGIYPLEAVSISTQQTKAGIFYWPVITDYIDGKLLITGDFSGYPSRE
jgi:hypothetical protein